MLVPVVKIRFVEKDAIQKIENTDMQTQNHHLLSDKGPHFFFGQVWYRLLD